MYFGKEKDMKVTSSIANKMLRQLEEDKHYWLEQETTGSFYTAAIGEEPVIPDYDYSTVAEKIEEIDLKVVKLRHAINLSNAQNKVKVEDEEFTIDSLLVRMAQLSRRKEILDRMRKQSEQKRMDSYSYIKRQVAPEYRYINYDLELIKNEFEKVSEKIMKMQMALDYYNQTTEFEADI